MNVVPSEFEPQFGEPPEAMHKAKQLARRREPTIEPCLAQCAVGRIHR